MPYYELSSADLFILLLINLVYTLIVLLLPFAIYRGIKREPISPKKAKRIVIIYMIVYSVLRFGFYLTLAALGGAVDGSEAVPNIPAMLFWYWVDKKILTKGYDVKLLENEHQFEQSVLNGQFCTSDNVKKQKSIKKHYLGFIYNRDYVKFISRITEIVANVFANKESAVIQRDFFDTKANEYHYRILVFSIFQYHCNSVSLKVNYKKCANILSEFCGNLIEKSPYEDGTKEIKADILSALSIKPFTPEMITEYYLNRIDATQADDQLIEELAASFNCFFEMLKQGATNYPDEPELIRALLLKSNYYYQECTVTTNETPTEDKPVSDIHIISPEKNDSNVLTVVRQIESSTTNTEDILYCKKCGARILTDSLFCHKCGEKVKHA